MSTEPRTLAAYFTYWREPELRAAVTVSPWELVELQPVDGRTAQWLRCFCSRRP